MASVIREPNGRRTIQFVGGDGKRPKIRLGKVPQKAAETFCRHVERLLAYKLTGHPLDAETAGWLTGLEPNMTKRLAEVGLIDSRAPRSKQALGGFIAEYVAGRVDVKPATKEIWRQGEKGLVKFYGADRPMREITPRDADDYKLHLIGKKLRPMTIRKRLQFAKTIFRAAVRSKLIAENPFADVQVKAAMSDRKSFVSRETIQKVLDACPDHHWRLIVALARYGGLRCPSEVLSLRWQDVDWVRRVIQVQSPKTEHHPGKESRALPLFPELLPYLNESYAADPEAVYVVDERHRKAAIGKQGWRNINLGTQMKRILAVADVEPWTRIFHNLRSSRETELVEKYPLPVVAAWMGHSVDVAVKHYCQVTDDHFARAAGIAKSPEMQAEKAVQKAVQQPSGTARNLPRTAGAKDLTQRSRKAEREPLPQVATSHENRNPLAPKGLADGAGFDASGATAVSSDCYKIGLAPRGAESGAVRDEIALATLDDDLRTILEAWKSLSTDAQRSVLAIVRREVEADRRE